MSEAWNTSHWAPVVVLAVWAWIRGRMHERAFLAGRWRMCQASKSQVLHPRVFRVHGDRTVSPENFGFDKSSDLFALSDLSEYLPAIWDGGTNGFVSCFWPRCLNWCRTLHCLYLSLRSNWGSYTSLLAPTVDTRTSSLGSAGWINLKTTSVVGDIFKGSWGATMAVFERNRYWIDR